MEKIQAKKNDSITLQVFLDQTDYVSSPEISFTKNRKNDKLYSETL